MATLSPRILTVDKRAERRRRLAATRRRVLWRQVLRSAGKALSLALSIVLCWNLFPWLTTATQNRAARTPPRSFANLARQGGDPLDEAPGILDILDPLDLPEPLELPDTSRIEGTPEALDHPFADTTEAESIIPVSVLPDNSENPPEDEAASPFLRPQTTPDTFSLTEEIENSAIKSRFAVLIDAQSGEILAERSSDVLMNPASMTKVLSLLVAVELLTRPDGSWDLDSYTWNTPEIASYCWQNDCSMAWFSVGEWVTIRDALYGMILPSGADAALMLANYTAGSQEAFVEKMNEKARELGLSPGAHFENCVGLYGENHVCTARDMAIIMKAAMDHPVCKTVLGKESWVTTRTEEHPGGIALVNRFLRRVPARNPVLTVTGAKTGYVSQAGNCAVSIARRDDGSCFLCVTGKGPGSAQVLQDHAALYRYFCAGMPLSED